MENQPKKVFEAFRKSMLAKTDDWMDLISEDVLLTGPLAQVSGKASFVEVNQAFFASIQTSKIYQLIENGDYIITQISTDVATPSGKIISLSVSEWYEIQDNLIQSLKVYFDTAELRNEMNPA